VKLLVPAPDPAGRAEILVKMIRKLIATHEVGGFRMFADDIDVDALAAETPDMTGADLAEVLRRAQLAKALQEARRAPTHRPSISTTYGDTLWRCGPRASRRRATPSALRRPPDNPNRSGLLPGQIPGPFGSPGDVSPRSVVRGPSMAVPLEVTGLRAPTLTASAQASMVPTITGVSSETPISDAASDVTVPPISPGHRNGGNSSRVEPIERREPPTSRLLSR
jgi:SpoVK/Ycf46/Vps4 family AAA+-type ATPase